MAVQAAIAQIKHAVSKNPGYPMILVPYLSPERLEELEREQVSGLDMCGNGIVVLHDRKVLILRSGKPNTIPQPRPLNNPYAGRSALVARMLLEKPTWNYLKDLVEAIHRAGGIVSVPQASKALSALEDDLIVWKQGIIALKQPELLLEKLDRAFERPAIRNRVYLRLRSKPDFGNRLKVEARLLWTVTGESSVIRYVGFVQSGPTKVAVSNLDRL